MTRSVHIDSVMTAAEGVHLDETKTRGRRGEILTRHDPPFVQMTTNALAGR
jgi:hypothetical protein